MKENSKDLFERYAREYVDTSYIALEALEVFDLENSYGEGWRDGNLPHIYLECSLGYDDYCDAIISDIRKGRPHNLNCSQIKEILRLRHMLNRYDVLMSGVEYPEDERALLKLMLDNPQWKKISRQSHKILELLRRPVTTA